MPVTDVHVSCTRKLHQIFDASFLYNFLYVCHRHYTLSIDHKAICALCIHGNPLLTGRDRCVMYYNLKTVISQNLHLRTLTITAI